MAYELFMTKYITISLPEAMLDYIEELRKHSLVQKKYHFTSKSDFVRTGVTMLIDKIELDIREEGTRYTLGIFDRKKETDTDDEDDLEA